MQMKGSSLGISKIVFQPTEWLRRHRIENIYVLRPSNTQQRDEKRNKREKDMIIQSKNAVRGLIREEK